MGILRFILALSVVTIHCGKLFGRFRMVDSTIAVETFFMISGFYMSLVLRNKYSPTLKGYWLFLSNRLLRLYPIYWIIAGLTFLLLVLNLPSIRGNFALLNTPTTLFVLFNNVSLFFQDWVYFFGLDANSGQLFFTTNFWKVKPMLYQYMLLPQGWSVSLELLFYIICPFLIQRSNKTLFILLFSSLFIRIFILGVLHWNNDPWTYRFFPSEMFFFLIGILIQRNADAWLHHKTNAYFLLMSLAIFSITYTKIPSIAIPYWPFSLKATGYFMLAGYAIPFLFHQFKHNTLDRYIGELSYPMYMSHFFIFYLTQIPALSFLHTGTFIALITILFSMLLIHYIATPIEKYRQSRILNNKT